MCCSPLRELSVFSKSVTYLGCARNEVFCWDKGGGYAWLGVGFDWGGGYLLGCQRDLIGTAGIGLVVSGI